MEEKVSIIVMSHLSDVQEMQHILQSPSIIKDINNKINFVKFIILQFNGDLNKETHPIRLWNLFTKTSYYQD